MYLGGKFQTKKPFERRKPRGEDDIKMDVKTNRYWQDTT